MKVCPSCGFALTLHSRTWAYFCPNVRCVNYMSTVVPVKVGDG